MLFSFLLVGARVLGLTWFEGDLESQDVPPLELFDALLSWTSWSTEEYLGSVWKLWSRTMMMKRIQMLTFSGKQGYFMPAFGRPLICESTRLHPSLPCCGTWHQVKLPSVLAGA